LAEPTIAPAAAPTNIRELVITLFELGREVTSVLDLDELLQKIPQLIARLTKFHAFAAYLLDEKGEELSIAYSVGYPEEAARLKLKVGSLSTTCAPILGTSKPFQDPTPNWSSRSGARAM
jgi:hypothetical protein